MVKYTIREGGRTTMKKARYRSGDTQGSSATNGKIATNISVDTQKGPGAANEKEARNIPVAIQKGLDFKNKKITRNTSVFGQGLSETNEKITRDIAVTRKGGEPLLKNCLLYTSPSPRD